MNRLKNILAGVDFPDCSKAALHADLIVLGTRGKTNVKYVLLGSTAERLLRDVPCSILAIKPPDLDTTASPTTQPTT